MLTTWVSFPREADHQPLILFFEEQCGLSSGGGEGIGREIEFTRGVAAPGREWNGGSREWGKRGGEAGEGPGKELRGWGRNG